MNITIIVSLVSTIITMILGVVGYLLKAKSEIRLKDSSRAEIDVKLSQLFTVLVSEAHARAKDSNTPVGHTSQIAAIVSLGELGNRYSILYEPAKAALNSFGIWLVDSYSEDELKKNRKEALEKALDILKK